VEPSKYQVVPIPSRPLRISTGVYLACAIASLRMRRRYALNRYLQAGFAHRSSFLPLFRPSTCLCPSFQLGSASTILVPRSENKAAVLDSPGPRKDPLRSIDCNVIRCHGICRSIMANIRANLDWTNAFSTTTLHNLPSPSPP
jgi:hypothetical protein